MNRVKIASCLVVAVLAACSSVDKRHIAGGNFEYLGNKPGKQIKLPEDVDSPDFSDAFKLPEIGENAPTDLVGDKVDIQAPSLVLPLVSGSHVEEGSKTALVWFDQIDDSQPLDVTIWNALVSFLEEQGIGVDDFDKQQGVLISDWFVIDEAKQAKWYHWSKPERKVGQKFKFSLNVKSHGRSASLAVDLVDYKEKATLESVELRQSKDERRNSVDILNRVIKHYEFQVRVESAKRIRQIRQGIDMQIGENRDGDSAYVLDAEYDIAWPRFLLVLRKLGFDVKDYDKSTGLLFATFNGVDEGWWDSLWGKNDLALDLKNEDYRFQLSELQDKTVVTMLDEDNTPFTPEKVSSLFPVLSKTMLSDDLDI